MRTAPYVVVGGGTMGVGIAYEIARSGAAVTVVEPEPGRRAEVVSTIGRVARRAVELGHLAASAVADLEQSVSVVEALGEIDRGPRAVIEAVPERLELKQEVLRAAERLEPELLATNTSSISITQIGTALDRPARLVGLHFFNPVWVNQLVEIVVTEGTSEALVGRAQDLVRALGKEAIVVRDTPGFASSRLGVLLGLEAMRMLEEGVASAADIDRAMELGYRHPMGPLRLTDLVGLDVRLAIAQNLAAHYGARFEPPQLLVDMVAAGQLGKKSGTGLYAWD